MPAGQGSSKPAPRSSSGTATRARDLMSAHPKYLVIFRERSPRNTSTMSRVLGVREATGASTRASYVTLMSKSDHGPSTRVFERLGVASTDLNPEELQRLQADDSVEKVVENEERQLPPIMEAHAGPSAGQANSAAENPPNQTHSWCLDLIGVGPTYSQLTGQGVRIAVLDTGIDLTHPDFSGRFVGGNDTASFVAGETVQDGHGHGTHCAGVVAASAQSSGGRRYSVAPSAELVIGKVLSDAGRGMDDRIVDGIDWAFDAGAQVISMSLGSIRRHGAPHLDLYETVAKTLLEQSPGVLIFAAAGNESQRPTYTMPVGNPAACASIFAIAAIDHQRRIADFSNCMMDTIGAVDFSAPGKAVYSAWTGGGFKTISGTSMATPHVAGIAALILQQNPALSASQVLGLMRQHCTPLGSASDFGAGLVRAP